MRDGGTVATPSKCASTNGPAVFGVRRLMIETVADSTARVNPLPTMRPKGTVRLTGESPEISALQLEIDRVARSDAKVLITGESGVGKEVVARSIHSLGARAGHVFAPVNCAGLPEALLESELFGHVKGSFTGAYRDKPGKLETAHMGTIFLDEVGEMTLRMQGLLLRFLETGELQKVGADGGGRSEEHTSELQSPCNLVCRLLLE